MKVLFLTHNFPRHSGDAPGSFILRLASALRNDGIETSVLAPADADYAAHDSLDGIPVDPAGRRYPPHSDRSRTRP